MRCAERGQSMIEYALVIGLVAIFVVAVALYILPGAREIYRRAIAPEDLGEGQAEASALVYGAVD